MYLLDPGSIAPVSSIDLIGSLFCVFGKTLLSNLGVSTENKVTSILYCASCIVLFKRHM